MEFLREIECYLSSLGFEPAEMPERLQSPFPLLATGSTGIIFHVVSVSDAIAHPVPPAFFSDLTDQALANGWQLVHLWEDLWVTKKPIVMSRLLSLLGRARRIHARSTVARRIAKDQAGPFLAENHLQGDASAYYKYGLFLKDRLVAVATFSKGRVMKDRVVPYRSFECVRFACELGTTVVGGLGKLISVFAGNHHPDHLMNYADRDWGTGKGYTALGFEWECNTSPEHFWVDTATLKRIYARKQPLMPQSPGRVVFSVYTAGNAKFVRDEHMLKNRSHE